MFEELRKRSWGRSKNQNEKEQKPFFTPSMEYFSKREQQEGVKKLWEFDKNLPLEKHSKFMER
jgi:hypothetical protein